MRVLYLTEETISFDRTLVRGGAIHVRRVVSGLRERGHDCLLLDWHADSDRAWHTSVAPASRFVDGAVRTFLAGRRIARRHSVDVVVSKTRKTYLPGLAVARAAGVPHIVHVGSLPESTGSGVVDRADMASFRARLRAPHDARLVVCEAIRESLVADGADPRTIYDVRNAVDADRFTPERAPTYPDKLTRACEATEGTTRVGFVGGLHDYKGVFDMAAALDRLDDVSLLIAGDGPARDRLASETDDRCRLLGAVPYESIPAVYDAIDVFILPSHTEGLPRVVLEAQASAIPVVATRVGGVPEVVTDGETGLLCPPRQPAALATAIDRLADEPALRAALGTAGRRAVGETFTWPRLLNRYERFLGEIVD